MLDSPSNLFQRRLSCTKALRFPSCGRIPEELGALRQLESLWIEDNDLTGEIPASLGQLAKLESLRLDQDKLSGNCLRRSRHVHVTPDCLNLTCALVGFILNLKVYRGKHYTYSPTHRRDSS
ncbi:Hypothetical leucine rich repeat protein [Ectocarpus siliculosus]|uniref:Hypothetical leucine rich repeat protein n=1 Tax=Ectocarpus siliculosus TaxID=2880 RepID=D8LGC0_ECTSI|nr:Hypothetical leucine rich repeat protein [Ectocarpus siliculosus]|eukprot:CBN79019.1 Hypothetical leucine rich repeat protein [Ectocarpus siliculosus]